MRRRAKSSSDAEPDHIAAEALVVALARRGATPDAIAERLDVGRDWVSSVLFRYRLDPDASAEIDHLIAARAGRRRAGEAA